MMTLRSRRFEGVWHTLLAGTALGLASWLACAFWTEPARADTFTMTPDDDWTILESAQAGDIVEIAPGTYRFRVYLSQAGSADNPIILRAQDPDNRPVWDLVGDSEETFVDTWPGSYGAGDNHRGCWQVAEEGAYYEISGIVFQNCRAPSSAGIRMINSGPVTIKDCLFQYNTNGLTGASTDLVVEHSEFFQNGKTLTQGNATHHIYIFGGAFALRYSYLHDGHEGQAFHVRARESTIEYNWITRPANYVGDIMSCEQFCGDPPHQQSMLVRGNVIVQGTPENASQLFALFRDADPDPAARMDLTLVHNTIVGTPRAGTHNVVNLRNDTVSAYLHASNNIVYAMGTMVELASPGDENWGVDGANNWFSSGATGTEGLTGSLFGADPGFVSLDTSDFTLMSGTEATGAAAPIAEAPDREYYRDEEVARLFRLRPTAMDLGAFESGNDTEPVGPYGTPPLPDDDADDDSSDEDAGGAGDETPPDDDTASDDDSNDDDDTAADDSTEDDDPPTPDDDTDGDDIADDSADDDSTGDDAADDSADDDTSTSDDDSANADDDSPADEMADDDSSDFPGDDTAGNNDGADDETPDAGPPTSSADTDGGCDCRTFTRSSPSAGLWILLLTMLPFARRREKPFRLGLQRASKQKASETCSRRFRR